MPVAVKKQYPEAFKRYNTFISLASKHYRDKGEVLSSKNLNKIYRRSKKDLKKVDTRHLKHVVSSYIEVKFFVEKKIKPCAVKHLTPLFSWFYFQNNLSDDNEYFNADDEINVDLSSIDKEDFVFKYKDLHRKSPELLRIIRPSEGILFKYADIVLKECKKKKDHNIYYYNFELDQEQTPSRKPIKDIEIIKAETEREKAKTEKIKEINKLIENLKDLGYSKDEIKQKIDELS